MKLPNYEKAVVPREKIVDYLLSFVHKDGRAKAEFFTRFGFASESWEVLADALKLYAGNNEVGKTVVLIYQNGKGYEVEFVALDGETIAVVSLYANQVRSIKEREIARVRAVELPLIA